MAETTLNLVVIRSADVERALQFYRRLGLAFVKHRHGNGSDHYAADLNGCVFEIYPLRNETDITENIRLGFQVADVDNLVSELAEAGIKIAVLPSNTEWGRRAVVEDPDEHRVELTSSNERQL